MIGKRGWIGWLVLVATIPLLLLLAIVGWQAATQRKATAELSQLKEKLVAANIPIDNSTMQRRFEERTHPEGAKAWEEVTMLCDVLVRSAPKDLPILGEGSLPRKGASGIEWKEAAKVNDFIKEFTPLRKRIAQASSYPKPVWSSGIRFDGYATLLPMLQESRNIVSLLQLDTFDALYQKDNRRALEDLRGMRATIDAFDWDFCAVALMINVAKSETLYMTIHRSMEFDLWNEKELQELGEMLGQARNSETTWKELVLGEQAMIQEAVKDPGRQLQSGLESQSGPWVHRIFPLKASDQLALLKLTQTYLSAVPRASAAHLENAKIMEESWRVAASTGPTNLRLLQPLFMTSYSSLASAFNREEEQRRLLRCALAAKQFQLKKGRWPVSVSDLAEIGLTKEDWTSLAETPFAITPDMDGVTLSSPSQSNPAVRSLFLGYVIDSITLR